MDRALLQNRAALLAIGFSLLTVISLLTAIPYMYRIVNDAEQSVIRRMKMFKVCLSKFYLKLEFAGCFGANA